jgi:hypothetical protein
MITNTQHVTVKIGNRMTLDKTTIVIIVFVPLAKEKNVKEDNSTVASEMNSKPPMPIDAYLDIFLYCERFLMTITKPIARTMTFGSVDGPRRIINGKSPKLPTPLSSATKNTAITRNVIATTGSSMPGR